MSLAKPHGALAAGNTTYPRFAIAALCDGALIGAFMISASAFGVLIFHPSSPIAGILMLLPPILRRAVMGIAMGATAIALCYSPLGRRSGALMNPAMTLTFWRMGKLTRDQALVYIASQFAGAAAGMALPFALMPRLLADDSVSFVTTVPGMYGRLPAWFGEFGITFLLVNVVMSVNRVPRLAPYTGCVAGLLVALFITFEAPLSGMSMNPARTTASSVFANLWTGGWIYFTAPPLGMLAAAEIHVRCARIPGRICGKLSHPVRDSCIFKCECRRTSDHQGSK